MQSQTDEMKKKLENMFVEAEAENGLIKVTATGNKRITNISINDEIISDKEALEDLIIVAVNKAIVKAEELHEKEMGSIAQNMLPGFGNIFGK
jgi:DNA-binding YbaB/EbfC family protein